MKRIVPLCLAICLALGFHALSGQPARAQDDAAATSYVTPFPDGDVYKVQVIGDQLAEGALSGLVEAFGSDSRLQINRKHRNLTGLVRSDFDDALKALDEAMEREPSQITLVMVGQDDRAAMRLASGKRLGLGSDEWREEYGQRVDRLMKVLKRRGGAVYWIGLPVMQRSEWNETIELINDLARDRSYLNGLKFIDVYAGFADENGSFVALGPDVGGLVRRLREADGVGFTQAGNRKLAHFVEREIRRDLNQAKSERNIPLAGAEAEQRKINPAKPAEAPVNAGVASTAPKPGEAKPTWLTTMTPPSPTANAAAEQKADNSRIALRTVTPGGREETANVDILRPAIPASVIQLMARNASAERGTQVGETLQDTLPGGLLLLSSVTPAVDLGGPGRRANLAPTQTPYFRVMVKGEQLPSKPGRADDFRWPRADQMPEPAPVQPAAASASPGAAAKPPEPKRPAPRS